ncbi:HAMP domain-containing sensor histidine kinase [Kineosporia mesophila]|uniref:histidine kinase n=1 Tax=Kineosporia mesophila TaxID=566012 RepID=A0ABP6ZNM8_9ACTN|nr:ATP-binding protein [Kineosporia mesophila]MCD5353447.1 HAMP domain-containing histidine kinase [Kineosporia mesophila]
MRLWPVSIRGRLVGAVVLTMAGVLAGSAAATAWGLNSYLDERVSTRMENVRGQIQRVVALNVANGGDLVVNQQQLDLLLGDNNNGLILVVDGKTGLAVDLPDVPAQQLIETASASPGRVVFIDGDDPVATLALPTKGLRFRIGAGSAVVEVDSLVLAVSRADDQQTVHRLIRIGLLVSLIAMALLAVLVALIVRAGLRPLTELASAVQAVGRGERDPDTIPMQGSTETGQVARAARDAFTARTRAEDRLRTFVADASHELRTPLTKIGGWVDLYLQGGLGGEAGTQAAMEKVEAETGRMGLLVEELSLLARLDAQVPLDLEGLDLRPLVEEVLDDARVVSAGRLFTRHVPAEPVTVQGDPERLRRVLRNLVGNAVQHTPPGTGVEVSVRAEDEVVTVAVSDHGEGIPAEQLPKLFERFWRADESRTRAKGGSGLGLAIVEAVVVAHGGSVGVTSQVGLGTTVTIRLPAAPPEVS